MTRIVVNRSCHGVVIEWVCMVDYSHSPIPVCRDNHLCLASSGIREIDDFLHIAGVLTGMAWVQRVSEITH